MNEYRKRLCKHIAKSVVALPKEAKLDRSVYHAVKRLKEVKEIHKANEVFDALTKPLYRKGVNPLHMFWLSAAIFPNLRKELYKHPVLNEYRKIQKTLFQLYSERRMTKEEREILKELKKEDKLTFKEVFITAFNELGIFLDWKKLHKFRLLTIPDHLWIAFTANYFSLQFSNQLKKMLWCWYYRVLLRKQPVCHIAKNRLKKVIDLEKIP